MQLDNYHRHVVMEPPSLSSPQSLQLFCSQFISLYPSRPSPIPTRRMSQTCLDDGVGCDLHGASSLEHLGHDVHHLLVIELVPDAIAREHHELVSRGDLEKRHFRRRRDVRRIEVACEAPQSGNGLDELFSLVKRRVRSYLQREVADAPRGLEHSLHIHGLSVVVFHQIALLCGSLRPLLLLGCACFSLRSSEGSRMLWSWVNAMASTASPRSDVRPSTARQSPADCEKRGGRGPLATRQWSL